MLSRSFMTPETSKSLLPYTPMLHSRMFKETAKFRDNHFQPLRSSLEKQLQPYEQSDLYLDGNPSIDRPLFAQFCANDPDELLQAALYVAPFCDAVDLNLGCPQGIARKGKYGAFLQEDQDLIYRLINKLHLNLPVPVTAKIRILETKEATLKYAQMVLDAGASILTVHGRHRDQKGHKTGLADWNIIRYLRENLTKETVMFANGNILRREDIDACLAATGVDGVMSAEGNLYDPAIFSDPPPVGEEGSVYWRGRDGKGGYRMDAVFRRYMDIIYNYVLEVPIPKREALFVPSDFSPELLASEAARNAVDEDEQPPQKKQKREKKEKSRNPNLTAMQPHLFHMLRPLVSKHHHIRDALAKCQSGDIVAFENVNQMVEKVVREALIQYEATDGKSYAEEAKVSEPAPVGDSSEATAESVANHESSLETVKACKRPWWICQPYVRPLPLEALKKGSLTLSKKELAKLAEEELKKVADVPKPAVTENGVAVTADVNGTPVMKVGAEHDVDEVRKEGLVCG
jgi:tRNA-dihydrouridine synthase 1